MLDVLSSLLAQSAPAAMSGKPVMGEFGIDTAQMDILVKPGDDFFKYVNGTWLATFKIPADKASYGASTLNDKAEEDVRTLLAELGKSAPPRARSARRSSTSTNRGWTKRQSKRAASRRSRPISTPSRPRSRRPTSRAHGPIDYTAPFGSYIFPDPADPTRYVVGISQSGLGMPVRDYYLNKGENFDAYRAAYKTYVNRILELIGDRTPAESAAAIIALETKIAEVHWPPEKQRDIQATNNPTDRAGLAK